MNRPTLLLLASTLILTPAALSAAAGETDAANGAAMEGVPAVELMPEPTVVKGYLQLGFDRLAGFPFETQPQPSDRKAPRWTGADLIPEVVKSWSGKKAELKGFMLPTRLEKGLVVEFLLMKDQNSCCYGATPSMNDYVIVKLAKGVPSEQDKVVKVAGTFKVETSFDSFGIMTGIYRLEGEKVTSSE
jgi:hypothetical protein